MEENMTNSEQVDNVLQSVSDEILAKRKRKRLISFSVVTFLCFALVFTIIMMSVIKINLKPSFVKPAGEIEVVINKQHATFEESFGKENYDKLNRTINNAFKTTYLTALFSGEAGGYKINETSDRFYASFVNGEGSGLYSSLQSKLGNNYVHFQYDELQTLKKSNGKDYTSVVVQGNQIIQFRDVYFTISNSDEMTKTTFYFGSCTNRENKTFSITVSANTSSIYEYVNSIQK